MIAQQREDARDAADDAEAALRERRQPARVLAGRRRGSRTRRRRRRCSETAQRAPSGQSQALARARSLLRSHGCCAASRTGRAASIRHSTDGVPTMALRQCMAEDTRPARRGRVPSDRHRPPDGDVEAVHGDAAARLERSGRAAPLRARVPPHGRRRSCASAGATTSATRGARSPWRMRPCTGRTARAVQLVPGPLPDGADARELDVLTLVACGLGNDAMALRSAPRGARCRPTWSASSASSASPTARRRGARRGAGPAAAAAARRDRRGRRGPVAVARLSAGDRRPSARARPPAPAVRGGQPDPAGRARHGRRPGDAGGATLAIREVNGRGGVGGRPVTHLVADVDIFDPTTSARVRAARGAGVDASPAATSSRRTSPARRPPPTGRRTCTRRPPSRRCGTFARRPDATATSSRSARRRRTTGRASSPSWTSSRGAVRGGRRTTGCCSWRRRCPAARW